MQVGGRHAAHLFPAVLDLTQLSLRAINVGHRQDGLSINEDRFLRDEVVAVLRVGGLVLGAASVEEHLLGGAETCPQRVVFLTRRARGGLPAVHELTVGTGGTRPVHGRGQSLGLSDQGFLHSLSLGLGLIELREELATVTVELGARGGETLPQLILDSLLQARAAALQVLPLIKEVAQGLTRLLPMGLGGILGDNSLGALNDRSALGESSSLGGLTLLTGDFLTLLGGLLNRRNALAQRRDVADDIRGGDLLAQRCESLVDVARAQRAQAILKKLDGGFEVCVATLVQSVGRSRNALGEAADDALLVSILDIDSAVLADTGEGVLGHLRSSDRRRDRGLLNRRRGSFGSGFVIRNRRRGHDIPSETRAYARRGCVPM